MHIVVLDAATLGEDLDLTPLVSRHTCTVYQNSTPEEVKERIADAEVIVINKIRLNGENLPAARSLRLICIAATGYDNIDVDYCRENGVEIGVITTPAPYAQSVCDLLVSAGIKAIWNFAPAHIYVPDGVLVQNENMACSLALLSKHLNEMLGE